MERISGILSKAPFQSLFREHKSRKMEREGKNIFFAKYVFHSTCCSNPKFKLGTLSLHTPFSPINLVSRHLWKALPKKEYFFDWGLLRTYCCLFFALCAGSMEWWELLLFGSKFAAIINTALTSRTKKIRSRFFSRTALLIPCSCFFAISEEEKGCKTSQFSPLVFSAKKVWTCQKKFSREILRYYTFFYSWLFCPIIDLQNFVSYYLTWSQLLPRNRKIIADYTLIATYTPASLRS